VYVASFPEFTGKRQISNNGGVQPVWRRDSHELFYLTPLGQLMTVAIGAGRSVTPDAGRAAAAVPDEPEPITAARGIRGHP